MNLTRRRLCNLLLLSALPMPALANSCSLTIGLFPNLPANKLATIYQPLATYLTQQLDCRVRLASAKDFRSFYQATRDKQFDLIVTAPNLAWLAMTESRYQPLASYTNRVSGVLVSKRGVHLDSLSSCRSKTIAFTDPLTIVSQLGLSYLQSHGLHADIDYQLTTYNNHTNAALAVVLGKADCAMIGKLPYSQMPTDIQHNLQIIAKTNEVTSQFIMGNPDLPDTARLRAALLGFAQTPAGLTFITEQHLGGIVPASPKDVAPAKPYALITQALLTAL
ncbi:MAG: phosphate/phosphite/phosphonate ABC transporter substrate-binding protein [Sulfuriferula sp.]